MCNVYYIKKKHSSEKRIENKQEVIYNGSNLCFLSKYK